MHVEVTRGTERYEVGVGVVAVAAQLAVMHLVLPPAFVCGLESGEDAATITLDDPLLRRARHGIVSAAADLTLSTQGRAPA